MIATEIARRAVTVSYLPYQIFCLVFKLASRDSSIARRAFVFKERDYIELGDKHNLEFLQCSMGVSTALTRACCPSIEISKSGLQALGRIVALLVSVIENECVNH